MDLPAAIGFGTVAILLALEKIGKTWGKKNFVIKYIASSRAVFVMVLFTLVSFFVNRERGAKPLWSITKVKTQGIAAPKAHDTELLMKVASRAFAPLVACALEHLAVGKAFERRNGYSIDQTQVRTDLGSYKREKEERVLISSCWHHIGAQLSRIYQRDQQFLQRDANQWCHVPDSGELRVSRQEPAQRGGHCRLHSLDHLRDFASPVLAAQGHAFCHHCEFPV